MEKILLIPEMRNMQESKKSVGILGYNSSSFLNIFNMTDRPLKFQSTIINPGNVLFYKGPDQLGIIFGEKLLLEDHVIIYDGKWDTLSIINMVKDNVKKK